VGGGLCTWSQARRQTGQTLAKARAKRSAHGKHRSGRLDHSAPGNVAAAAAARANATLAALAACAAACAAEPAVSAVAAPVLGNGLLVLLLLLLLLLAALLLLVALALLGLASAR
jgi:hypothetical protein